MIVSQLFQQLLMQQFISRLYPENFDLLIVFNKLFNKYFLC